MALWRSLIRGTEMNQLLDLVSPALFDVLSARQLAGTARTLWRNWNDRSGFESVRHRAAGSLDALPIRFASNAEHAADGHAPVDPEARGRAVLGAYFVGLWSPSPTVLDLRHDRFSDSAGELLWNPAPLWFEWDAEFIEALRELYAGFYDDAPSRFRAALRELSLSGAEDVMRKHFAPSEAVRFDTASFRATFHEVFVKCRDDGVRLHPDFVPLGLYLATLYEHLEQLDRAFDVREVFERVVPGREADRSQAESASRA